MSLEKGKISDSQLIFSIVAFIYGSSLLTAFTTSFTKQSTWLVVISSFIVSVPFSIVFSLLAKNFFGMNWVQILNTVYGSMLGKILTILYILDFLLDLIYNTRDIGDFYINFLITDIPLDFFIFIFIFSCAYAVNKGIEILAYVSHLFVSIATLIIIFTFFLLIKDMDFSNLLPVLEISPHKFLQGTHILSTVFFGETIVFLNVMPSLKDSKNLVKNNLIALFIGIFSILVVVIRNTTSLGITETILLSPSFQAARLIEVGNVFNRMDLLIGIGNTIVMFFKACILYYATVLCIAQLFNLRTYKPLILPVGGITAIGASIIFTSTVDHAVAGQGYVIIARSLTIYVLPLLTLIVAKLRKLSNTPKG